MKKVLIPMLLAFIAALPPTNGQGDEEKKPADKPFGGDNPLSAIMHKKLEYAQQVLEGITVENYAKVGKNADLLLILSKKAEWRVFKTPEYQTHSNEFQRTAEKLMKSAKEKNLDASALAYVEMTLNCVRCHKYVREVRMTRLDGNDLGTAVAHTNPKR
jgi:hypothetical protein